MYTTLMRNKRIRSTAHTDLLDSFYKIITNAQTSGRGKEMVLITKNTFSKIADAVQKLQCKKRGEYFRQDIAQVLNEIRWGSRYDRLDMNTFSGRYKNLIVPIPRRVLSSYLTEAIKLLNLGVKDHKITLNTLYTSGKIHQVADGVGFDPIYECMRYGIPTI